MMLAASTAIQASSPTERPFPRSMQIVKAAFFVAQNAFHRETYFVYPDPNKPKKSAPKEFAIS